MNLPPDVFNAVIERAGGVESKKTIGGFFKNVGSSGVKLVGDVGSAVLNPIDTGKNVLNLGRSIVELAIPGEQGNEQLARDVGKFYVDRYGSVDKALNSFYTDPVGVMADISTVLGGAGAIAKIGKAGKLGNALTKASRFTDPLAIATKPFGLAKKGIKKAGSVVSEFGDNYPLMGYGNPKVTGNVAKQIKKMGMTPKQFFDKYPELYSAEQSVFEELAKQTGKKYSSGALQTQGVSKQALLDAYQKAAERMKKAGEFSKDASKIQQAQYFIDRIAEFQNLPEIITPEQFYSITKGLDSSIPNNTFLKGQAELQGKPVQALMRERNILRGELKRQVPELRQLGRETNVTMNLAKLLENQQGRALARQPVNFTKLGSAGVGVVVAGIPGAIAGYGIESLANSQKGKQAISSVLSGVGKTMQTGVKAPQIAKNRYAKLPQPVRQGIKKAPSTLYGQARVNRMLPQQQEQPKPDVVSPLTRPTAQTKKFTVEQFKQPKKRQSVFTNNAGFGKTFTLKKGSFN